MRLAHVDLTPQELSALLQMTQARAAEVERMVQNLEEGEGIDLQRHNLLKTLRPQVEALQDLATKLEGALRETQAR